MIEAGYPGFVLDTYTLMLLPTQTPADVVERLSRAVRTILQKSDVRDKLRAVGLEVTASGPDELKARFARELPMWRDVVKIAGIPPQ
jgi:tripartite-type tricarboxylate transporter receptor subunit TctC